MGKDILVSTISACYKMERYLSGFLTSFHRQTFLDKMEVVLDHNEPTEQELQRVRGFQKEHPGRIRHIVREKVDPIGTSLNRCIRESSGELLAIWNVDDIRTDRSIELQARLLLDNPGINLAYGDYTMVDSFGSINGDVVQHTGIPPSEFTRSMIFGPFFMFRKSVCEKIGFFDEQLKSGADFDMAVRLAFCGKAKMVQGELGYYLNEGLGASTRCNSLQPIERTVIELRYGIYDKIDYHYLPQALKYRIYELQIGGRWVAIENFVPDYAEMMSKRYKLWLDKGLKNYVNLIKENKGIIGQGLRKVKSVMGWNK